MVIKNQFAGIINTAVEGEPFNLDFLTAIAIQESYEVWGRAYKAKTPSEVLKLCVGDILDASGGRDPKAFPQSRAVLERAPRGAEMFKIARQALEDMAEVAPEYKKYLKNKNKFCHAFGIFQYDIQAFTHDSDYFLNRDWGDFPKCLGKCLMELHESWGRTYPNKKKLSDKEMVYVAIAYNQGHADTKKSFKQGYKGKGDTKYYGEYIWDYMQLNTFGTICSCRRASPSRRAGLATRTRHPTTRGGAAGAWVVREAVTWGAARGPPFSRFLKPGGRCRRRAIAETTGESSIAPRLARGRGVARHRISFRAISWEGAAGFDPS